MIENPIRWPNGYRCAVNFSFDMDAESLLHIYFPDTAHNQWLWRRLRYGPEVAVPRSSMRSSGWPSRRSSFPVGAWSNIPDHRAHWSTQDRAPRYMHEKINQLTREEERTVFFVRSST